MLLAYKGLSSFQISSLDKEGSHAVFIVEEDGKQVMYACSAINKFMKNALQAQLLQNKLRIVATGTLEIEGRELKSFSGVEDEKPNLSNLNALFDYFDTHDIDYRNSNVITPFNPNDLYEDVESIEVADQYSTNAVKLGHAITMDLLQKVSEEITTSLPDVESPQSPSSKTELDKFKQNLKKQMDEVKQELDLFSQEKKKRQKGFKGFIRSLFKKLSNKPSSSEKITSAEKLSTEIENIKTDIDASDESLEKALNTALDALQTQLEESALKDQSNKGERLLNQKINQFKKQKISLKKLQTTADERQEPSAKKI